MELSSVSGYLIEQHLSSALNLSLQQVRTLLVLRSLPVMDYDISERLGLYARSKMRRAVLNPLHQAGWICFHSFPPESNFGAPRVAWCINNDRCDELDQMIENARHEVDTLMSLVQLASGGLARALLNKTPPQ